jgi:hypothetical protein
MNMNMGGNSDEELDNILDKVHFKNSSPKNKGGKHLNSQINELNIDKGHLYMKKISQDSGKSKNKS